MRSHKQRNEHTESDRHTQIRVPADNFSQFLTCAIFLPKFLPSFLQSACSSWRWPVIFSKVSKECDIRFKTHFSSSKSWRSVAFPPGFFDFSDASEPYSTMSPMSSMQKQHGAKLAIRQQQVCWRRTSRIFSKAMESAFLVHPSHRFSLTYLVVICA